MAPAECTLTAERGVSGDPLFLYQRESPIWGLMELHDHEFQRRPDDGKLTSARIDGTYYRAWGLPAKL